MSAPQTTMQTFALLWAQEESRDPLEITVEIVTLTENANIMRMRMGKALMKAYDADGIATMGNTGWSNKA